MAAPQWRPNYFCLLSFHQIIYSPVGPAEALEWGPSLQDLNEHVSLGLRDVRVYATTYKHIETKTKDHMQKPPCFLFRSKTNISLTHRQESSSLFSHS